MRARTINEIQNFERGKNPKSAMGVGGINLYDVYDERIEELEMNIQGARVSADNDWIDYLEKTFRGKKITAVMMKMATFNSDKKNMSWKDAKRGEFTIVVQDIRSDQALSDGAGREGYTVVPRIILADMDNNMYSMDLKQKIYID